MKTKNILWFLGIVLGILFLGVSQDRAQAKPERKGPIITNGFAVEKGVYGYIWKIYLEGEDPDGEMLRIASVVDQPGYGHYPTDWIYLKPGFQKHFKGYIQWSTFSSKGIALKEGDQIILRVSVIDNLGNESNEVVFPFTFISGVKEQSKPPASFDQEDIPRLGFISIDLKSPGMCF
jgi:hypothetical protein